MKSHILGLFFAGIILCSCMDQVVPTRNSPFVSPESTYTSIPTQELTNTPDPMQTPSIIEIPTQEYTPTISTTNTPLPPIIEVTPFGGNGVGYYGTVEYIKSTNLRNCVAVLPIPLPLDFDPEVWFRGIDPTSACSVSYVYVPHNISRLVAMVKVSGHSTWAWHSPNAEFVSALCYNGVQFARVYEAWFPYANQDGSVDFQQAPPALNPCE